MPTKLLPEANNVLSIYQLNAQAILNTIRKIIISGKPRQLYEKIYVKETREGTEWRIKGTPKLTISRSNLVEKGIKLWNQLTQETKSITNTQTFKKMCKEWVKKNIHIKPG